MVELCVVFLLPRDVSHANADAVCVMMLALGVGFCVQMALFIFVTWGWWRMLSFCYANTIYYLTLPKVLYL